MPVAIRSYAHPLIQRAAAQRGVATASYIRRAVLAMVAHDLQMPLEEVLEHDPRVAAMDSIGSGVSEPEGQLFGPWRIVEVRR